jgi:Holliday junction resolvase RusA-like endonuclease
MTEQPRDVACTIIVEGRPRSQPRPQFRTLHFGVKCPRCHRGMQTRSDAFTPEDAPVMLFRRQVIDAWRIARPTFRGDLALALEIDLTIPIGERKRWWTWDHAKNRDCDNLAKPIMDALTGRAWVDDSQVADLRVRKRLGPEGRAVIRIAPLDPADADWDGDRLALLERAKR